MNLGKVFSLSDHFLIDKTEAIWVPEEYCEENECANFVKLLSELVKQTDSTIKILEITDCLKIVACVVAIASSDEWRLWVIEYAWHVASLF